MGLDPKVKNIIKFITINLIVPVAVIFVLIRVAGVTDYVRLFGQTTLAYLFYRIGLQMHRRLVQKPKDFRKMGKWAIVTGTTSGIGRAFADHLASKGMHLLIISRSESKLKEQQDEIQKQHNVTVHYLAYDFTKAGAERKAFYAALDQQLQVLHQDGGISLLINNVGIANEIPRTIEEFTDEEVEDMIQCNVFSTTGMTRAVFKYMKQRKDGSIVAISSGSCNAPAPFLAVYSATKAFMVQFSRSLKIEWWDSGVDFYVVTPFYVVSNLYKRRSGTIIAPMPDKLVKGTLAQIGKRYVLEGHGYWFHGTLQWLGYIYWNTYARNRQMMVDNRKRFDDRQQSKKAAAAAAAATADADADTLVNDSELSKKEK